MSPYSPSASAKISIKIIPTKILSCIELERTPESPTTPIANPAALIKTYQSNIKKEPIVF